MAPGDTRARDELFLAAAALPPVERARYLEEACPDPVVRAEIESLLEFDQPTDDFLEEPVIKPMVSDLILETDRPPPERIGRFQIRRVLGAGGMGVVYEAVDEHPRRTVALKVIRRGIASASVLRRFDHEAQVLAMLQHPGIAQIYETGTADTGGGPQPYFAMELVNGLALTEFARARSLRTRERLELFALICDAIHHAHQKGVVHRDIKPANILVDSERHPKVLDFGVARVTDANVHNTTIRTNIGQLVGTLTYMSPEQVSANPDSVDTRSDVYSLGVVLYELLAGTAPHDLKAVPVPEAVRTICESDPAPISSINRVFRGDIETIVGRALEKDRERRYQSASDLAADIRRYLRNEPIVARRPSTAYHVHKFARRNTALVAGLAGIFLALCAGIIATSHQARLARTAQRAAEEQERQTAFEANTHKEVTRLLQQMLASADPDVAQGREITVRELLEAASRDISDFDGKPEVRAALEHTIGTTFAALGDLIDAFEHLDSAVDLRLATLGPDHAETVRSQIALAEVVYTVRGQDEAARRIEDTVRGAERVLDPADPDRYRALHLRARLAFAEGDHEGATARMKRAMDQALASLGPDHVTTLDMTIGYASMLMAARRLEASLDLMQRSVDGLRRTLGPEHSKTLHAQTLLGQVVMLNGRIDEAEALFAQALETRRTMLGDGHIETRRSIHLLASFFQMQKRFDDAVPLVRELVDSTAQVPEADVTLVGYHRQLARCLQAAGRADEAVSVYYDCYAQAAERFGAEDETTLRIVVDLVGALRDDGHSAEALSVITPLLSLELDEARPRRTAAVIMYGACLTDLERHEEAEATLLDVRTRLADFGQDSDSLRRVDSELVRLYEVTGDDLRAAEFRRDVVPAVPAEDFRHGG